MLKAKFGALEDLFSSKKDKEVNVTPSVNAEDEKETASCTNEGAEMTDEQVGMF